jgi:hypothetical protein
MSERSVRAYSLSHRTLLPISAICILGSLLPLPPPLPTQVVLRPSPLATRVPNGGGPVAMPPRCKGAIKVGRPAMSLPWARAAEPYEASFDSCAAARPLGGGIWLTYDSQMKQDGAGAQIQRILGAYTVAASLNFGYIHTPLAVIGYQGVQALEKGVGDAGLVGRWNAAISLSDSGSTLCKGGEIGRNVPEGAIAADGCRHVYVTKPSYDELGTFARLHCSGAPLVVHMLHASGVLDVQPARGRHPRLSFGEVFPWLHVAPQTERIRVAVHVRRGELFVVDSDRMLPNSYYIAICKSLAAVFDQLRLPYIFEIYTEQVSQNITVTNDHHGIVGRLSAPTVIDPKSTHLEDFDVLARKEMLVNLDALESFQRMATAHVFVMSRSSFSYAAASLVDITRGIVIYYPFWHQPLPGWTVVHPNVLQPGPAPPSLELRTRAQLAAAISRVFTPTTCPAPPQIVHVVALGDHYISRAQSTNFGEAILHLNPGYKLNIVDETASLRLLQDHFPEYVELYALLPHIAWRSDLVRYVLMYLYGGVYIDLDLQPLVGFDALMLRTQLPAPAPPTRSVFCLGARAVPPFEGANGFMVAPANDTIFLTLASGMRDLLNSSDYGASVKYFFAALSARYNGMREYTAIDGAFFLREVEVARLSSSPSYTMNVQPDECVLLSDGWAGTSWPET